MAGRQEAAAEIRNRLRTDQPFAIRKSPLQGRLEFVTDEGVFLGVRRRRQRIAGVGGVDARQRPGGVPANQRVRVSSCRHQHRNGLVGPPVAERHADVTGGP